MNALFDPHLLQSFEFLAQDLRLVKARVTDKRYFQTTGFGLDVRHCTSFV